jgi:hypothetical protein
MQTGNEFLYYHYYREEGNWWQWIFFNVVRKLPTTSLLMLPEVVVDVRCITGNLIGPG